MGSKVTTDGDCRYRTERHLLLGRKVMSNLDSILKSRDITDADKGAHGQCYGYLTVTHRCESWTIKKAGTKESMLSNCGAGEDS